MKQLKDKIMSEMEKPDMKEGKPMSKDEVKMMMLEHLRNAMDDMMKEDMQPDPEQAANMAKVSVMAKDPTHLKEGLQKAEEMLDASKYKESNDVPNDHEQIEQEDMENDEDEELHPSDDTEMHEEDNLEDDEEEPYKRK